uniref:Uncharacterized protein n=1 Tax=Lactuca sativa TaxID=4236 RepID=A0A9R1WBN2_LACSA|nr:hypothetical protein LSAT_V11C200071600 [Lactuca sativa]
MFRLTHMSWRTKSHDWKKKMIESGGRSVTVIRSGTNDGKPSGVVKIVDFGKVIEDKKNNVVEPVKEKNCEVRTNGKKEVDSDSSSSSAGGNRRKKRSTKKEVKQRALGVQMKQKVEVAVLMMEKQIDVLQRPKIDLQVLLLKCNIAILGKNQVHCYYVRKSLPDLSRKEPESKVKIKDQNSKKTTLEEQELVKNGVVKDKEKEKELQLLTA